MQWYESLNDAAKRGPGRSEFEPGDTEIWFGRLSQMVTSESLCTAAYLGWKPHIFDLGKRYSPHVLLGMIRETDLEIIFALMQGECWSPNGEAAALIRSKGLDHTSMSVGDVVKIGERAWICHPVGWTELEP